jgi:hypothetical protein
MCATRCCGALRFESPPAEGSSSWMTAISAVSSYWASAETAGGGAGSSGAASPSLAAWRAARAAAPLEGADSRSCGQGRGASRGDVKHRRRRSECDCRWALILGAKCASYFQAPQNASPGITSMVSSHIPERGTSHVPQL